MAIIDPTYKSADAHGMPSFEVLDTFIQSFLLAGAEPALIPPSRILLGDSLDLAQFTVVGLDATRKLVRATWNATETSAIKPIGVLAHQVASGATNTTVFGEVWLTGCFNVAADSPLVWDASYDTTAKKLVYLTGNADLVFRTR